MSENFDLTDNSKTEAKEQNKIQGEKNCILSQNNLIKIVNRVKKIKVNFNLSQTKQRLIHDINTQVCQCFECWRDQN